MKETGIPMSTLEIRAYLEGRKTMTRRVIKDPRKRKAYNPISSLSAHGGIYSMGDTRRELEISKNIKPNFPCPYGQVGDVLWWKERALYWAGGAGGTSNVVYTDDPEISHLIEDNNRLLMGREITNILEGKNVIGKWQWKPSLFMPRRFSRISTPITGLRVERLQNITEEDAIAEGLEKIEWGWRNYYSPSFKGEANMWASPITSYKSLWDSLNAKRGHPWTANDWVFVIEFPRWKKEEK